MPCWKVAGGAHRQTRISGRDSSESSSYSFTHIRHLQLLPLCLPLQDKVTSARSRRTFRCFSRSHVLSLLPTTLLAAGSGRRVAGVSGLLEIDETREQEGQEEPLPAGVMKKGGEGSAKKIYSVSQADYQLLEEVGFGGTATVYRAMYIPRNEIVAVKCLDLHRSNSNLDDLRREAQMMCLIDHPNVVKGYCSFVVEHSLWAVMPFMAEGSCLHLMKAAYPQGFEEHVIGSLLKETLKAIEYLHRHGHIHRDVKAGNILLDSSGAVKLADFGAAAYMFDKGDRLRSRNTFVGTPCWMAPEVLQPGGGYDFKADIWSFGITALELAHGHAPFSKYPPMKVLLMTSRVLLQD
ncbi:hypothetical protein HPP92_007157 [Vanilla planifolia]|uniref:Protein kinase domain-containing protein n=1 Tax=Vanilla planifolia TaxID=51239 RepID=A0A835RFP5_VANPL|nr:hypothetical protein HPP92_007157 [Vanilla planifolia]